MADGAVTAIGLLGYGEAARAFRETLTGALPELRFVAWDIKLDGPDGGTMRDLMAGEGVAPCDDAAGLGQADLVISAVTADQSLEAVRPLVPALGPGVIVIDVNSVSPGRKRATAALIEATGARYADLAVMAPVHPRGHRTPVLLAGDAGVERFLDRADFDWSRAGAEVGAATAIKMVRSTFVKGLEAITVEALLAAERSGCREAVVASLAASYPGLNLPDAAAYMLERTTTHGARRAAEMHEVAATLDELGLGGGLARAIAAVQAAQGRVGPGARPDQDLAGGLARVLAGRLADPKKEHRDVDPAIQA